MIIGAGPIGLSVAQFANLSGAFVAVADRSISRLRFVEKLGLSNISIVVEDTLTEALLKSYLDNALPTVIIDASGNKASMLNTFNLACFGGKIIFVGLFQGEVVFNDPNFHRRQLNLMASRNAMPEDFKKIISLLETKQINTDPWISHRCNFEDLPQTFETFLQPEQEVIKAIIDF